MGFLEYVFCNGQEETTPRQITYPSFILHSVLAVLKQINEIAIPIKKKRLLRNILSKIKLLKEFSKHAPQNYENKYTLSQAFLFEFKGMPELASKYFYNSSQQA